VSTFEDSFSTVISWKNWGSESERLKAVCGFTSLPVYKEDRADEK